MKDRSRPLKVLAIGAHPDDLEISVAGTLLRHREMNDEVTGVVVSIPYDKENRRKETIAAAEILGINLKILDLDASQIQFDRSFVGVIDGLLKEYRPDVLYTHWLHDSHQDHHHIAQATIAAARHNLCSVYMYEQTIPGGIGADAFRAQSYIDISNVIDKKMESVLAHKSQIFRNREWWLNGLKGRCAYHGYQIGVQYAEVFEVVKEINRI